MSALANKNGAYPVEGASPYGMTSTLLGESVFKSVDLMETVRLLRRRMKLVAQMAGFGLAFGLTLALMMTPKYRAETILVLDRRQTHVVETNSVVSALPTDNSSLRSEIDIMSSRAVLNRVVKRLHLIDDPEFSHRLTWLRWANPSNWLGGSKVTDEEKENRAVAETAHELSRRLNVQNDGRSMSIHIAFESKDPEKAAQIANSVADEYLVDQLEAKYDATARANKWLNERLSVLRQQVEATEHVVSDFREKTKLIEVNGSTVAARQLDEINSQLTAARGQTSQAEARLRSAQSMVRSRGGFEAAADVLASPLIQKLREQEADLRRAEADMATRYGERHPRMIKAHAEIRDLQNKIAEEVQKIIQALANEVEVARAKETQLHSDLRSLEGKAGTEMKDSIQLRQLQREADANRLLYESFLNRFKQTSEQQDLQMADSRIIARADPPLSPTFPSKVLFMIGGGILGLILGIIAAYLVEYFDRGFRSGPQAEEVTGLPTIGLIPSLKGVTEKTPEEYVIEKPMSSYSEALRTVRTAIHFSDVDHPPKSVMVTSATPSEGKTTFCISLARALAKSGNKILLVDADLRRPRIAHVLGLSNKRPGLTDLLAGTKSLAEVIEHDRVVPALDIIPARGKTPNAQDLLGSQRMQDFIRDVREKYDLVIVDTPPILAVADSAVVAKTVDTVLFIVRWAQTPRDTVVQALKQLNNFNCKVAGIVLSQVNIPELATYGEGYHHYHYNEYYTN